MAKRLTTLFGFMSLVLAVCPVSILRAFLNTAVIDKTTNLSGKN